MEKCDQFALDLIFNFEVIFFILIVDDTHTILFHYNRTRLRNFISSKRLSSNFKYILN